MSSDNSVTVWLHLLRAGDRRAAGPLWDRYFRRRVGLARERLRARGVPRGAADEEDAALLALNSFFRGAEAGRFPDLADRNSLWRLLFAITGRKVSRLARGAARQAYALGEALHDDVALAEAVAAEPTPEEVAILAEESHRLLDKLCDDGLRRIAVLHLEGQTKEEIAQRVGLSARTVFRKLALIRDCWDKEGKPS